MFDSSKSTAWRIPRFTGDRLLQKLHDEQPGDIYKDDTSSPLFCDFTKLSSYQHFIAVVSFTNIMAEIFGAVAAGIAVCHEMCQLAKAIREAAKDIKNAPRDVATLTDETIIFTGLYSTFLKTCEDNSGTCRGATPSITRLKVWAESTIERLRKLLQEADAISPTSNTRYSLRKTTKASIKWLVKRNVVVALKASLDVARQSIEGFTNLMCIRKLNEELAILRDALTNLERRRVLERKLDMTLEYKIQSIETSL